MAQSNETIITQAYLQGTSDFQQNVPDPTQTGIQSTIDFLTDPMNHKYYNQFVDMLITRIGMTVVHQQQWRNRLAVFEKGMLNYGNTVQEMVPKWIRAHAYDPDAVDVFKASHVDIASWYHTVNRRDRYDVTVNDTQLRPSFADPMGLNKLVAAIMQTPINASEYDTYVIYRELLAKYEDKWGFFKAKAAGSLGTKEQADNLLVEIGTYVEMMGFPTALYNAKEFDDVPVFATPEEMVLITTPRVNANIDVRTLANTFHIERADKLPSRKVVVDSIPIDGAYAILTTKDLIQSWNTVQTMREQENGKTLDHNYFYHLHSINSISPFVPAVLFTSADGTGVTTIVVTATGITVSPATANANAGSKVELTTTLNGTTTPAGTPIKVAPNACTYDVVVNRTQAGSTVAVLDATTFVDDMGVLHVGPKLKVGDKVTVTATSNYRDASDKNKRLTGKSVITIK